MTPFAKNQKTLGLNARIEAVLQSLIRLLVRRPFISLLVLALLTGGSVWMGSKLGIRTNMEDLFPESTPHVARAKEVREMLGFSSQVKLIIGSPDREANIRFATDLSERLLEHPKIQSVEYRRDVEFFRKNAMLFLPLEDLVDIQQKVKRRVKKALASELGPFDDSGGGAVDAGDLDDEEDMDEDFGDGPEVAAGDLEDEDEMDEDFGDGPSKAAAEATDEPTDESEEEGLAIPDEDELREKYGLDQFSEYFISSDGTVMAVKAFPTVSPNEIDDSKQLLADIDGIIQSLDPTSYHPEMEYAMEGDYHKKIEEMNVIKDDLSRSTGLAGILIFSLLILYFGRIRTLLFVMIPLLAGIAWTMGVAWLSVGYLNMITAFIFAILFGLGVDFAIHAASRYQEERSAGLPVEEALVRGLSRLGRPMLAAAFTTSATFLSLSLFEFRGFSQFGIIAGVGVVVCFIAVVIVMPPIVRIADMIWTEKKTRFGDRISRPPSFARGPRGALITLAVILGAVLALAPGLGELIFDPDMSKVMTKNKKKKNELLRTFRRKVSSRSMSPVIVPTGDLEETGALHRYLEEEGHRFDRLGDFASIWSFIPEDQQEKLALVGDIRNRITKKRGALKGKDLEDADRAMEFLSPATFTPHDLPGWVKKKFTDKQDRLGTFLLMFAHGDKADADDVGRIIAQLDSLTVNGKTYYSTASYYIVYDAYEIVRKEGPIAMGVAAMAVLLLLLIDLRRIRWTLMAFLPLPLGMVAFLGLSGYMGWNLNIFNMVILPTLFGIGIDTSIHLIHRARELVPGETATGHEPGFGEVVGSTGAAAGMSSATTAAGFASMTMSTNPGLGSIGLMAPIGIFICYLASVLITGSLLRFWLRRRAAKTEARSA